MMNTSTESRIFKSFGNGSFFVLSLEDCAEAGSVPVSEKGVVWNES